MFNRLRGKFKELGMDHKYVAKKLNLDKSSISLRMTGKREWLLSEMYAILKLINEPAEKLHEYFPKDGHDDVQTTQQRQGQLPNEPIEIEIHLTVEANGNVLVKL